MNKASIILSFLCLLICSCSVTETPDFTRLCGAEHPRLLMSGDEFTDIVRKCNSSEPGYEFLKQISDIIVAQAENDLYDRDTVGYIFDESHKRILAQSRRACSYLFEWAYAFRLTGRKDFAQQAISMLYHVCSFPDWNAKHFLDAAEMATGVSFAYDWMYDEIPDDLKHNVEEALLNYCLIPGRTHFFRDVATNWNQVCHAGVCCAAIAMHDVYPEISEAALTDAVTDNVKAQMLYAPDGNYPEGYVYWNYGTSFEVLLLNVLNHAFGSCYGLDETPGFEHSGRWLQYMEGPSGYSFNYFDNGSGRYPNSGKKIFPQPALWWFAVLNEDTSLVFSETQKLANGEYDDFKTNLMPMIPCLIKDLVFSTSIPEPSQKIWHGRGSSPVVLVRESWDKDSRYLAVKGGTSAISHAHMDVGSFVYDEFGCRWAADPGNEDYALTEKIFASRGGDYWEMSASSMRWDVFKLTNMAHNTLVINGGKQTIGGYSPLVKYYDKDGKRGGCFDISPAYEGQLAKARRTVLLTEEALEITDRIVTLKKSSPDTLQWRMVTPAKVEVTDSCVILSQNGYEKILRTSRDNVRYFTLPTKGPNVWDSDVDSMTIVGFETVLAPGTRTDIVTELINRKK